MINNKFVVICQVAFTYIGAIVGAGFASGQELVKFFSVYGNKGIMGAVLSGLLLGVFGVLVVSIVEHKHMESYDQLLRYLFGKKMGLFFDGLVSIFLLSSLAVMFVAGGSLLNQLWGVPLWQGFLLTMVVIYLFLLLGIEGVLWFNTALVPGLVVLTLTIAGISLKKNRIAVAVCTELNLVGDHWFMAALLYVSYNFVLGAVILSSLGYTAKNGGKNGVLLGGAILGLMVAIMSFALFNQGAVEMGEAIPMLVLAKEVHPLTGWIYSFVLWIAILTTAMSLGFGLLKRLQSFILLPRAISALLVFFPTLPFLYWSFPQMVAIIYPLIGYIGFVFLLVILVKTLPYKWLGK